MTVRVGVNGFGRIGRNFYRAVDAQRAAGNTDVEIVAVNDLTDNATLAHLLKYDSILGRLPHDVSVEGDEIVVGDRRIKALAIKEGPAALPWGDLGVDVVIESTGIFTDAAKARGHLDAGAKKVVVSAPAKGDALTVVMGVNDGRLRRQPGHHLQRLLHHELPRPDGQGARRVLRHPARADDHDPRLHPGPEPPGRPHSDLRRARAAALNVVPTSTGAAKAISLVLPQLEGKLDGYALRVPVPTGSATDLTVTVGRGHHPPRPSTPPSGPRPKAR